jgi:hypothetical protein
MSGRGVLLCPPCTESPFASLRCYLAEDSVYRYLSQHYPALIAPTGSCARPTPSHLPRLSLRQWVFAGCCEPRLGIGPSRRCLCESFSACLDPYPGGSCGARTRFFPQDNGLPDVRTRSAPSHIHTATSVWACFRGCNHSLMFRPADLLATPIAPTAAPLGTGQPWLLRPRLSRFVTSPSSGYANRPFRATDGQGTSTP